MSNEIQYVQHAKRIRNVKVFHKSHHLVLFSLLLCEHGIKCNCTNIIHIEEHLTFKG